MVGDDERIHPHIDQLAGLRRVQHAFDNQRQPGVRAQPAQLVPTGRLLHQRGAKQRRAVDAAGLRARGDVAQVGRLHTGGQGKAGAFDAGIHRPDDGLVAGVFGPLHQL